MGVLELGKYGELEKRELPSLSAKGGARLFLFFFKNYLEAFSFQGACANLLSFLPYSFPVEEGKGLHMVIMEKANLSSLPCGSLCVAFLWTKE